MAKRKKPDFSKPKPIVSKSKKSLQKNLDSFDTLLEENKNEEKKSTVDSSLEQKEELKFDTSKIYTNLPLVVIAGRPNVGKSTLFNRFIKKRVAITDPTPGVTRDPVEGDTFILGKPVHLMDTGGYKLTRDIGSMEAVMDELVVEKTLESLKKADAILFLMEAGIVTGEDE